ncbi:hypothetical protein Tco_1397370 [Tanacetum coccineum]
MKGKGVDTNFRKSSILEKPPLKPLKNQPVVRQPTAFKSERSSFSKHQFTSQVVENNDFTKPVTPQSWPQSSKESVGSNDLVHNYDLEEAKKNTQLQKGKALNSKPSVITPARLPNTTSGSQPTPGNYNQQTRNWSPSMSSQCVYTANYDACILKYLSEVNSHASAQKTYAQSHKTTKRYILVEKKSNSKNHGRHVPIGQRFSPNKSSAVYVKITPPRYGLTWKPTGRIFTYDGLRWIPTRKTVETCINTNDSDLPLGKKTCTPDIVICMNSSSLSAGTSMASEPISSKGSTNVWEAVMKVMAEIMVAVMEIMPIDQVLRGREVVTFRLRTLSEARLRTLEKAMLRSLEKARL